MKKQRMTKEGLGFYICLLGVFFSVVLFMDTHYFTVPYITMNEVTRIEIIGNNGREYTNAKIISHELSYQDDGKTLKIFITTKEDD